MTSMIELVEPVAPSGAYSIAGEKRGDEASTSAARAPKSEAGMSRTWWAWGRLLGGVAIVGILFWRLGTGPFLAGVRAIDGWSVAAGAGIAVLTTVCCAWRWTLVARGLGVGLPLRTAVAGYYRSQFLNSVLPGGVLGDVHRAVHHGRGVGNVGRGLRAVAWERSAGQAVQLGLALLVLLLAPSPVRSAMPFVVGTIVAGVLVVVLIGGALPHSGPSRWARALRTAGSDIRHGLFARRAWPGVVVASTVVVACHVATFLIAARAAGSTASLWRVLPLALPALLAMGLPTNVGGWGPREGVAAWAFGMAGLSADQGVTAAVVYGVLVLIASLPGAAVMAAAWLRREPHAPEVAARG